MMKLLFPAPLLSIALFILWLLLNHSVSRGHIVLGVILGLLIPIITRGLRPLPVRVRHPWTIFKLFCTVVVDTSISNFQVVRFCCSHRCAGIQQPLCTFRWSSKTPTHWPCCP